MAKILRLRSISTEALQQRKSNLLSRLAVPPEALRASCVKQYLTCGKKNCRCGDGMKHGPFEYLVQCLAPGKIRKFLLKTGEQRRQARSAVAAYATFQERLEQLSQINAELMRRGESL